MNRTFLLICHLIFSFTPLFFSSSILLAQDTVKVPYMFVSMQDSKERVASLTQPGFPAGSPSKKAIMEKILADPPLQYTHPVVTYIKFFKTIDSINLKNHGTGVRAYFAAFNDGFEKPADFKMDKVRDKQLLVVFVPSKGRTLADIPFYYFFNPGDSIPQVLKKEIAQEWIANYDRIYNNAAGFVSTLDTSKQDNQREGMTPGPLSDTKSIYYESDNIESFFNKERLHQNQRSTDNPTGTAIDSIEMDFAAMPVTGIGTNPSGIDTSRFKKRLFLLFEFKKDGNIFYIDQVPGFGHRPRIRLTKTQKQRRNGGDNGQLCPPKCPT